MPQPAAHRGRGPGAPRFPRDLPPRHRQRPARHRLHQRHDGDGRGRRPLRPLPAPGRGDHALRDDGGDLRPRDAGARLLRALPAGHRSPARAAACGSSSRRWRSPGTCTRSRPCGSSRARRAASSSTTASSTRAWTAGPAARASCGSRPAQVVALDLDDPEQARRLKEACDEALAADHSGPGDEHVYTCGAGRNTFTVDPYGSLQLCQLSRRNGYDVKAGTFDQGWNEHLPRLRARTWQSNDVCRRCSLISLCASCAGAAELEHGDPEAIVAHFCEVTHLRTFALSDERRRPCSRRDLLPGRGWEGRAGGLARQCPGRGRRRRWVRQRRMRQQRAHPAHPDRPASRLKRRPARDRRPPSRLRVRVADVTLHLHSREGFPLRLPRGDGGVPRLPRERHRRRGRCAARSRPRRRRSRCSSPAGSGPSTGTGGACCT